MTINQIKAYHGKRVTVNLRTGKKIEGALAFYNFEQQIIHLSSYVIFTKDGEKIADEGEFIVINQREWSTMRVKHE